MSDPYNSRVPVDTIDFEAPGEIEVTTVQEASRGIRRFIRVVDSESQLERIEMFTPATPARTLSELQLPERTR